jgi:hypothetical protein
METLPKIPCTSSVRDGVHLLTFTCDYCTEGRGARKRKAIHQHGGPTGGHRLAHCHDPNSPYLARGYILEVSE